MKPTEQMKKFKESSIELGSELLILMRTTKMNVIIIVFLLSSSLTLATVVNEQQIEINEQKETISEQSKLIDQNAVKEKEAKEQKTEDVEEQPQEVKEEQQMRSLGIFELTHTALAHNVHRRGTELPQQEQQPP